MSANSRNERVESTHLEGLKLSWTTWMMMRTCRQCQGASRTSGSSRRSCQTHQNASTTLSEEVNSLNHMAALRPRQAHQAYWRRHVRSPDAGGAYPSKIPVQHDTAEVENTRSCTLNITRAVTYHIWTPLNAAAQGHWTLLIIHSILILFIGI